MDNQISRVRNSVGGELLLLAYLVWQTRCW